MGLPMMPEGVLKRQLLVELATAGRDDADQLLRQVHQHVAQGGLESLQPRIVRILDRGRSRRAGGEQQAGVVG